MTRKGQTRRVHYQVRASNSSVLGREQKQQSVLTFLTDLASLRFECHEGHFGINSAIAIPKIAIPATQIMTICKPK